MSTVVITPEMQRANAEVLLGKDPGKFRDPGQRWTAKRRSELQRLLKQTDADQPVTILNLNPFPLRINGGVYFPDEVPACRVGEPYATHIIRHTRWGHRDLGCDAQNMMQIEPVPAIPLVLAAEYIREYVQREGGFGGVLCYAGTQRPETMKKGAKVRIPEVSYNDQGEFYVEVEERDFHELLAAVRRKRDESLLRRIEAASAWFENDSQRTHINDIHREMARLAFHEGLIPELPRWVMQAATLKNKLPAPCPSCASQPKPGAILCVNCGHIFDVVAAYRNARIAYGAVEMDRLSAEEWKIVNQIKAERDKARGRA